MPTALVIGGRRGIGAAVVEALAEAGFDVVALDPATGAMRAVVGGRRIERKGFNRALRAKRKLMNVSISCDHRVVDGWDAASFVQALKRLIETPVLLLAD